MIYLIGIISSCFVTGYVFFDVMGALYEKKYANNRVLYLGMFILYAVLSIAISYSKIPVLNVLYSMTALCGLSYLLYDTHGKNVIINSAIVIIYLAIIDMMITTVFSAFTAESAYIALQHPEFFLVSGIGNALAMLCTMRLLVHLILRCQISKVSKALHIYMIFLLIFEIGILSYFLRNSSDAAHNMPLLLMSIGFIIVDGGVLYLFKVFSRNATLEKQTELAGQQREMIVKYYEGLQEEYEQTQKFLHDVKRHIRVLCDLDQTEESLRSEYSKELLESVENVHRQFLCSDKIISMIIDDKIRTCQSEGIAFDINMQDIEFDFMEKIEVTSLFANLLDNAIEACLRSRKDKNEIELRIHRFKDYIVIKTRNTVGDIPNIKDGGLVSTKKGHQGMGMLILKNIADKYCGNLAYDFSEEYFETKIILSTCAKN